MAGLYFFIHNKKYVYVHTKILPKLRKITRAALGLLGTFFMSAVKQSEQSVTDKQTDRQTSKQTDISTYRKHPPRGPMLLKSMIIPYLLKTYIQRLDINHKKCPLLGRYPTL